MARRTLSHISQVATDTRIGSDITTAWELSSLLGITERRIQQLVKEGMPKSGRGEYPLRECVRFYVGHLHRLIEEEKSDTVVSEKIRLMRAKAEKAEVEVLKLRGEVLDLERVRQETMLISVEIKEAFLAVAGRLAPELAGKDAGYIKHRLNRAITEAMNVAAEKLEALNEGADGSGSDDTEDEDV